MRPPGSLQLLVSVNVKGSVTFTDVALCMRSNQIERTQWYNILKYKTVRRNKLRGLELFSEKALQINNISYDHLLYPD